MEAAFALSGHGYFWWRGEAASSPFPPLEQRVAGHLSVDAKGLIKLDLHGVLPGRDAMESILGVSLASDRVICGVLKTGTKFVTLLGLSAAGGQAGGLSHESFAAEKCLISDAMPSEMLFSKLVVPLNGFEAWSSPGTIDVEAGASNQLRVTLEKNKGRVYFMDGWSLEVAHHFDGYRPGPADIECDVRLASAFVVRFNDSASIEEVYDCYRSLQDLLLVLTGSSRLLNWPSLEMATEGSVIRFRFYFRRFGLPEGNLAWFESWTSYPRLRSIFGQILRRWFSARGRLGPGIYLFLGTKRDIPLYAEHRFVNLVWGLETLHRRALADEGANDVALKEKMSRIRAVVARCRTLNYSDRRWLNKTIERQITEPGLDKRLVDLFRWLSLGLDDARIKEFSKNCAKLRNDLSHFGGERSEGDYEGFIEGVRRYTGALSFLYHLTILKTIGLEGDTLRWVAYQRPGAGANLGALVEAGLISRNKYMEIVGAGRPVHP